MEYHKLSTEEKIKHLKEQQEELQGKFDRLFKTFRGVIHEDSASEMKYAMIKVLESQLNSIREELKLLEQEGK